VADVETRRKRREIGLFGSSEPAYRWLIVCQRLGHSCVPRGSPYSLSALGMNPFAGLSDQANMQVKTEQCQRGLIG
jgi:hypothetical protein